MSANDKYVKNQLICLLGKNSDALIFINDLMATGELLFFGGAIRDICLNPENPPMPRDFDIAIKFKNYDRFENILYKYQFRKNRFGGYKFNVADLEFDVWDLANTWAFKNTDLQVSEENLAKSVFLNIDGIVYNFNKSKLYDELFKNSVLAGKIDINLDINPQIELNLLRAIVFKNKYQLNFSNKLKEVFKGYLEERAEILVNQLYELQETHYKCDYLSKEKIERELQYV